ncbi:hypothetical protein [Roseateles sp.]|uniref:hypothetical protein n=1 Tax=Roseateles sp. TaxID=1971397 RepID=UPI0031D61D2B
MDADRKRQLKKLGKAEVARQSAELRASLTDANPAALGDSAWANNHKTGILREKWLKKKLPLLRQKKLEQLFVVLPIVSAGWRPTLGGYIQCRTCGSASPSSIPERKFFYWATCGCGNIRWRCIGPFRRVVVRAPDQILPVTLIGRG